MRNQHMLLGLVVSVMIAATGCGAQSSAKGTDKEISTDAKASSATPSTETANTEASKTAEASTAPALPEVRMVTNEPKEDFPQLSGSLEGAIIATMKTNRGNIKLALYKDLAPKTVENFVELSKKGYYNGIIFHRVVNDFMIQGGDPQGTGIGGESIYGAPFEDEFTPKLFNINGAISMANAGPNTNGSQFFIVQNKNLPGGFIQLFDRLIANPEDNEANNILKANYGGATIPKVIMEKYIELGGTPFLDYKHTVFGQVIEGMDVVDKIATTKVTTDASGEESSPVEPVIIESVTIQE